MSEALLAGRLASHLAVATAFALLFGVATALPPRPANFRWSAAGVPVVGLRLTLVALLLINSWGIFDTRPLVPWFEWFAAAATALATGWVLLLPQPHPRWDSWLMAVSTLLVVGLSVSVGIEQLAGTSWPVGLWSGFGLLGTGGLRSAEAVFYPVVALLIIQKLIRAAVEQPGPGTKPELEASSTSKPEPVEAWAEKFSHRIGGIAESAPGSEPPEQMETLKAELRLALEELAEVKSQTEGHRPIPVDSLTSPIEGRADVISSVETAVAQVAGSLKERDQSLHLDLAGSLPSVNGDPDELRQILVTLIENAIRASPAGAVIPVSALATDSADGAWVSLSVSDSGGGIPPEDLGRVFHSPEPGRGTESGLARVKQLAEGMGGRVWLGSEVGGGSTVTVLIPARSE